MRGAIHRGEDINRASTVEGLGSMGQIQNGLKRDDGTSWESQLGTGKGACI